MKDKTLHKIKHHDKRDTNPEKLEDRQEGRFNINIPSNY